MSNRIQLKSEMKDKDILSETLNALGIEHTVHEDNATVNDYYHDKVTSKACIVVSEFVGFVKSEENGNLEMVGDVHYEKGLLRKNDCMKKVEQVYKAMNVFHTLQAAGYQVNADFDNCLEQDEIEVEAGIPYGDLT